MNQVTLTKAKVQHYGYKENYINPLGFDTPTDEVKLVSVVYESDKKEKVEHYEIRYADRETVEVEVLPDFITLEA